MKRYTLIFVGIIALGALLRLINLSSVPPGLSHDEVSLGYNAYAILQAGIDEYGESYPFLFRAFDEYKLPGTIYLLVPFIPLFGLNELGVRLPAAVFGILAIPLIYAFTRHILSQDSRYKRHATHVGLLAAIFLSISLWHINFSRQLFESTIATTIMLGGLVLLLHKAKRTWYLYAGLLLLGLSTYFYYTPRIMVPFLLLVFLILEKSWIHRHRHHAVLATLLFVLVTAPVISSLFSTEGRARISQVTVVSDSAYVGRFDDYTRAIARNPTVATKLLYNRRIALVETVAENYMRNINPDHLFLNATGHTGLLYLFEIPFIAVGLLSLTRLKTRYKWYALVWILTAPLAGALSTDQPNALRTLPLALMIAVSSGFGLHTLFTAIKPTAWRKIVWFTYAVVSIFLIIHSMYIYFDLTPHQNAIRFADGQKQMAQFVQKNQDQYDHIYVSGYYWRPYIFTLFWNKVSPMDYAESGSPAGYANITFTDSDWDEGGIFFGDETFPTELFEEDKKLLFLLSPREFQLHETLFEKIDTIDGRNARKVYIVGTPNATSAQTDLLR